MEYTKKAPAINLTQASRHTFLAASARHQRTSLFQIVPSRACEGVALASTTNITINKIPRAGVDTDTAARYSSSRQAHHISDAGPASTSQREVMNGSAHRRLDCRQKLSLNGRQEDKVPKVVDHEELFSAEARERMMPGLRLLATAFNGLPDMIPLHGGLPPASAFPLSGIQLTLKDGTKIDINDPKELVAAQQYNLTLKGQANLLKWVTEHTQQLHGASPLHESIITSGSNYTLEIIMRVFMNPGDAMLCEEYTYPHVPESMVLPVRYRSIRMEIDNHGIIPERLLATLEGMEAKGERLPKLLYTIPVGQNPTGATQTAERKREIYAICRRFNIMIMEDDPYYYLQYTPGEPPRGLKGLGISYLSIDEDARVCRLDSFSKILSPGVRIAWLTAHPKVIDKVLFHLHGVAMGPCSLSQVVVGAILDRLGPSGFEGHIKDIQAQYARRAGIIMAAAEKHLKGLAEWSPVGAGMFLWLKLCGFEDASQILSELNNAKVIVVPGKLARHSGPSGPTPCPFVRLSFVTAPEGDLEVAIERLAGLLHKFKGQEKPPIPTIPAFKVPMDQGEVL